MSKSHYQTLEMPPSSSHDALRARYLALVKALHPDLPGNEDGAAMRQLTEAWGVLRDPARRARYDAQLALAGQQCSKCKGRGTTERTVRFNHKEERLCTACAGTGQE